MKAPVLIHINRGTNVRYCAVARRAGCRSWKPLMEWPRSRRKAFTVLAFAMATQGHWKRARVLHIADYYDPSVVAEMVRR